MTTLRGPFVFLGVVAVLGVASFSIAAQNEPKPVSLSKAASQADSRVILQVTGEVGHPLALSADEFAKLPRRTVEAKGHDGTLSRYDGVAPVELLAKSGAPVGKDLRGPALAVYLVVQAADNYRAVFALPELDPLFTDRVILLADRRDGKPLSAREGPLQVIVPGEKKHARWVRQVIKLRIARA
jgi:hypothetical protein